MGTNVRAAVFSPGRLWWIWYFLLALVAFAVFTRPPSILTGQEVKLTAAYELKARQPFADTSKLAAGKHPGTQSHGAKLTPRLVGSILLYWTRIFSWHPYLPATLFGFAFLLSGIWVGYQVTGDRLVGLYLALTYAGLYAAAACFSVNWGPKPFDGIAIGLLGLTMLSMKRLWVLASLSFLACWTDERCILSLALIGFLVLAWPECDRRSAVNRCLTIAASVGIYLVTRLLLAVALDWGMPDLSGVNVIPQLAILVSQLAAWTCFEGGWISIIMAAVVLRTHRDYFRLCSFLGLVAVAIIACLVVADVSRASSFAFPLIPASYALLKRYGVGPRELRVLAGAGAAISLLAPNFEIVAGMTVTWLPSYLPILFP